MNVQNPQYNSNGTIDIEINHPEFGWIPFTADPNDTEEHGRALYHEAKSGKFGPIQPAISEAQ